MFRLLPLSLLLLPLPASAAGLAPIGELNPAAYRLALSWSATDPLLSTAAPAYAIFQAPAAPAARPLPDLYDELQPAASEPFVLFDSRSPILELDLWFVPGAPLLRLP